MSDWYDDEFHSVSGKHNKHMFKKPVTDEELIVDGKKTRQYPTVGDFPLGEFNYLDWDITGDLPTEFDWRDLNVVTPAK